MYVVRSDNNNMAMSTVPCYGETDYNRSFVLTAFPFQMPKNCCVPHCTKKFTLKKEKRFLFIDFPKKKPVGLVDSSNSKGYWPILPNKQEYECLLKALQTGGL